MNESTISIAVVDDDASFARAISRLLGATGFGSSTYRSAEVFLQEYNHVSADCLVLDIELGGLSGLELHRRLISQGITTPVIFVTACDEPELREEARQAGCSAFLCKPVSGELLINAIRHAINVAQK